ncbi:MAG: LbtU family siderophore porin [Thermodesulfobacteriota bacterium]
MDWKKTINRYLTLTLGLMAILVWSAAPSEAAPEKSAEQRANKLSTRIEALEKQLAERNGPLDWIENLAVSGLIETEAAYAKYQPADDHLPDEEASDIVLSTLEIGLDTRINEHLSGHALFLWEEDDTEPVDLDEGFITLSGGAKLPAYLEAGKFYVPFGQYDSYFISDPLTLELGETRESALLAGGRAGGFDLSAGVFNGDVDEIGTDDHMDSYFASASYALPERVLPGTGVQAGISYLSNIADSDGLEAENDVNGDGSADGISDSVAGISGYIAADFQNRVFFIAEFTGATSEFAADEMAFAAGTPKPRAWNTELAYIFANDFGLGAKYEGTDDGGTLLPETRYGGIAFCQPFTGGYLGLECLQEKFANDDENIAVTAQLAYEF